MSALPAAHEIAAHYAQVMQDTAGDYIHHRWGDSETKRRHYRQTETALGAALARAGEPGEVLEIGCGPAVWTPLFLARARRVLLYDLSDAMLAGARRRIGEIDGGRHAEKVSYRCGDFVAEPPAGESFDTVVSVRAFEYMSDKGAFVRACHGMLRPGGSLVVATKNRGWRDLRGVGEAAAKGGLPVGLAMQADMWSAPQLAALFREVGFVDVEARPVVFGSYRGRFTSRPALAAFDALHRWRRDRPMAAALDGWVESFVVTGR
ncbi:MAG TPA: class I SAM-dependent methyltransferase, partial [Longimicrobium sp.]|nr:class I SAM-dependent methyltransferase [Longimicrobium sp.]